MSFPFFKYNSNGNDFVIIDDRKEKFLEKQNIIQRLCQRQFSIGADGLILLQKSEAANYKMKIFNSDGKEADMCGNGLLCFVKFIFDNIEKKDFFLIETKKNIYKTYVSNTRVFFYSNLPKIIKKNYLIDLKTDKFFSYIIDAGVKHSVIFLKNIQKIDVFNIGKKIRDHKSFFPGGINVDFCEVLNDKKIKVRVYEKGVENETTCCSTGAMAVFLAFSDLKKTKDLDLIFQGGKIKVLLDNNKLKLIGNPKYAFHGSTYLFA